jgi:hypothetical protein
LDYQPSNSEGRQATGENLQECINHGHIHLSFNGFDFQELPLLLIEIKKEVAVSLGHQSL